MKLTKASFIKWALLLLVLLLQLLTVLVLNHADQFYVVTEQLLEDPEFVQGDKYWKKSGAGYVRHSGNSISLISEKEVGYTLFQTFPVEAPGFYLFESNVEVQNIQAVAEADGAAELLLVYRNDLGARNGDGKILFIAQTKKLKAHYGEMVQLGDEVHSVDFAIRLKQASGTVIVDSPVVSRLAELPGYKKVSARLIAMWAVVLLILAVVAVRLFSIVQLFVLGAVAGIALVGVLLPEGVMSTLYGYIAVILPSSLLESLREFLSQIFGYPVLPVSGGGIGKVGHFFVFLILGVTAGLNAHRLGVVYSLAVLATFALFTEVIQLFVIGRTTSAVDFMIDFLAAVVGLGVGVLIYKVLMLRPKSVDDTP